MQAVVEARRILVIDDEPAVVRYISNALVGHEVSIAHTAAVGLELAAQTWPDVVILDYHLPDRSGRDVIDALRDGGCDAKILLISGGLQIEELTEWVAYLTDDFIAKPFSREALRMKIDRLLWRHATERRLAKQHEELVALHEANAREAEAARVLLDQVGRRAVIDRDRVRIDAMSATEFCGDAVFAHPVEGGCYRWLVGDATGHTLASALATIPISTVFYGTALLNRPLPYVLTMLDSELSATLPVTMFFAATICELSADRRKLLVANAGMPDLLIRRVDGRLDAVASDWPPFGVRRWPGGATTPIEVDVEPGDRIYAFSDGLTEVRNPAGELFGIERVRQVLGVGAAASAFGRLAAAWREHTDGLDPDDDISIVEILV